MYSNAVMKLIVIIIFFIFIAQGFFNASTLAQDAETNEEDSNASTLAQDAETNEKDSTAASETGEESDGSFVSYSSTMKTFVVRYADKRNPNAFNEVTYYYDENTKVEGPRDEIEDLRSGDKVEVHTRKSEAQAQHFNITRSTEHIADRVVVRKKK